jgi:hypothetical protein
VDAAFMPAGAEDSGGLCPGDDRGGPQAIGTILASPRGPPALATRRCW